MLKALNDGVSFLSLNCIQLQLPDAQLKKYSSSCVCLPPRPSITDSM